MAKITRSNQKVFGQDAPAQDNFTVFGSVKSGPTTYSKNLEEIQGGSAWANGLADAIVANYAPVMQDFNSLFHLFSKQLAYLFQAGIPEWNTDTVYYQYSLVQDSGKIYQSKTNENTGNPVSNETHWKILSLGGGGIKKRMNPNGNFRCWQRKVNSSSAYFLKPQNVAAIANDQAGRYSQADLWRISCLYDENWRLEKFTSEIDPTKFGMRIYHPTPDRTIPITSYCAVSTAIRSDNAAAVVGDYLSISGKIKFYKTCQLMVSVWTLNTLEAAYRHDTLVTNTSTTATRVEQFFQYVSEGQLLEFSHKTTDVMPANAANGIVVLFTFAHSDDLIGNFAQFEQVQIEKGNATDFEDQSDYAELVECQKQLEVFKWESDLSVSEQNKYRGPAIPCLSTSTSNLVEGFITRRIESQYPTRVIQIENGASDRIIMRTTPVNYAVAYSTANTSQIVPKFTDRVSTSFVISAGTGSNGSYFLMGQKQSGTGVGPYMFISSEL